MASSEMGPDMTTRHACHCGKSFIRKEHLIRHQATHITPAYVCNVCQRQFSRRDLLRRHSDLHEASYQRNAVSCDACRVNKTKCSGGNPCSLCNRRGIECIYRPLLRQPKRAPQAAAIASVGENVDHHDQYHGVNAGQGTSDDDDDDDDDETTLPKRSKPENSLELLQRNVKFLQNLNIVPSQPTTTSSSLSSPGMGGIYELLVAGKVLLESAVRECSESKARVSRYIDTYIKNFHLRWPILHAPTLHNEIGTMPLPLAAAACLIGAWFQNSADWTERFYALRVHELLLERSLHSLIDLELTSEEKAWPIEFFQAVLLTLVFSLHRTDKSALSRAMLLRSTFMTILRELGVLDDDKLAVHLKTYYSGTYAPYTLVMRERFKRLLVFVYQFDAYFALIHGTPPLLHLQEVSIGLPSTFALWNAYGLDVFALRELEQLPERSAVRVSEIPNCADSITSSGLLVEDVHLGLCSLLQSIWVLSQTPNKKESPSHTFQQSLLIQTLDQWKQALDKINELTGPGNFTGNAARYLFLAYRGEDDSIAASLERITALLQDAMILYYYMKMTHYVVDVVGPRKQVDSQTELWQTSKDRKEALVCAVQVLKIVESKKTFNPLVRHALATGVDVMIVLLSGQKCHLSGKHAVNNTSQHWSDIGGSFWIDGTPVCVCKLVFWVGRFEKAIEDQMIMVEWCPESIKTDMKGSVDMPLGSTLKNQPM
ncbi:hypothetical protein EYB25_000580 [Talaromyces marneffei]|nr:hypothetical protein EYB25_000580 [Talaromyces marneffei]